MAELFKNIYNIAFFENFYNNLKQIIPNFNEKKFQQLLFDKKWNDRELKARMRHIATTLKRFLADDYTGSIYQLIKLIEILKINSPGQELQHMFIPDYIEQYGIEEYKISILAFEKITQYTSCEFAVRPFIIKYQEKMMKQMHIWSKHDHYGVRRLATEGCRPRLPWAMALPDLKHNPNSIIPILKNLINDDSNFVRRSVANNLNDISKDNPNIVIGLVKLWKGKNKDTDWILKHGSRTLLKQGNLQVMKLFGFGSIKYIKIDEFKILTPVINIGDHLEFTFELSNNNSIDEKIRLEYGLYYQKANGSVSKKVFKISEKTYKQNSTTKINRKQSFKIITTRKFHMGQHQLSIIINGVEFNKLDFILANRG